MENEEVRQYMETKIVELKERLDQDWEIAESMFAGAIQEGRGTALDLQALLSYYKGAAQASAMLNLYAELYNDQDARELLSETNRDVKVVEDGLIDILTRLTNFHNRRR